MEIKDRLDRLRDARRETWKELAFALQCSDGTLFSCMSGRRNPSRRLLRRIEDLESGKPELNIAAQSVVKESPGVYMSRKQLNIVEIEHRLATISAEVAAIRELLKEASHE